MLKIGIIGRGWGARVQEPAFREAGFDVAKVAGRAEWKDVVGSRDIDLITVVLPPLMHREIAIAALEAGKHVISEKPTAMNAAEAEELVAAAKRHPSQIAIIDHELRFLPAWRAARERIGEIGALRYAEVRYASPGRGDRNREWNWWSDADQGGGIWGAVGSHFLDTLRYLGFEVEAAQATLHTAIAERPSDKGPRRVTSDDIAAVNLRLSGGALAMLSIAAVASGPDEPATITLHGESGAMRLTGEELLLAHPMKPFVRIAGNDLQQRVGNSPGGAFGTGTFLLARAVRLAIENGDRAALASAATFEDGLAQQRALDAAKRSSQNDGRWERLSI
ncbi:MAG TPA: Gfo/Idh/MocA family oxidoreductase [Thermoanaerobaculia bacterium]